MGYKIGSFNVHNLSYGAGRDLDRIAKIITDNKLDIVALQEVLSEGKALIGNHLNSLTAQEKAYERSLKSRLGKDWEVRWAQPSIHAKDYPYLGQDQRNEGYAFLWRRSRVELIEDERKGAVIFDNYNVEKEQIRLKRDPYYGRFKIKACNAEIRLVTVHLLYGKPKAENMSVSVDDGAIEMRRNEFKVVAGRIYPRISEYYKDVRCHVPYTIILGDYNLNLKSSNAGSAIMPDVICFNKKGREIIGDKEVAYRIYTVQDELTTLKKEGAGYANNYDHFSYDQRVKEHIVSRVSRINAVSTMGEPGENDFEVYRKAVSDHLPIVLEIDFK